MSRRRGANQQAKPPEDPFLVGYHFSFEKDKNPYDFIADPERPGFRIGSTYKTSGSARADLTTGLDNKTLPPKMVWDNGCWLSEMDPTEAKAFTWPGRSADDDFATWVVDGEGTPGNFIYRLYLLPDNQAAANKPRHPIHWSKADQEGKKPSYPPPYAGKQIGLGIATPTKAISPPKPAASTLPVGIRFRCPGCGHWWKESTLASHANFCCPARAGDEGDWAIMCECCETLDEVSTVKPGFPRKLKEVTKKSETAATEAVPAAAATS